jgi:hypothetical protein
MVKLYFYSHLVFLWPLVYSIAIWYDVWHVVIFFHFGLLYLEKSGKSGLNNQLVKLCYFSIEALNTQRSYIISSQKKNNIFFRHDRHNSVKEMCLAFCVN